MRTRSSSNLLVESPPNPSTSNPKCRNRRRSKQPFILEESPVDTMTDQHTMTKLLRAPIEGYAEAIVVLPILAEQFELKHRTTNLRNEISNFQQRFDESFHEVWDRYTDLLCACPHHGFTELYQLDTFYNALNPADQDSLNSAAGGNLLERRTQDVLIIIENKSKVCNSRNKSVVSQVKSSDANSNSSSKIAKLTHAVNQQTSAVTTAMTAILKQFQATPPPAFVKAIEEICVTCDGAHPYYQCLAVGGNTFAKLRDNIQGYVATAAVNYNQGNSVYHPSVMANQIQPPASMSNQTNELKNMMASFFQMNTASTLGLGSLPSNTIANPKGELKFITTRSGIVLDEPSVPIPTLFINSEEDECVEETLTDQISLSIPSSEYKCKALADLGASINLMPLSIWKKLGLPKLISTRMTLELANRAICTPAGIARDVFVPVDKFTLPADFVIVDYESDPRVPLILGRPFLQTAHALIDVHEEEMILHDCDERLTLNMRHDTSSYSNQPKKESINLINVFNDSSEVFLKNLFSTNHQSGNPTFSSYPILTSPKVKDDIFDPEGVNVLPEKLLDLDSTKDLHPPHHVNPLSDRTTSSSSPNQLLEEFADELTLITFPLRNDDLLSDIDNLADLNDNLVDSMTEMFTNKHALDYSSPLLYDEYDDDLFEVESNTENVYDDPFDSKGEKIKEFKLLIDELDLPCDFLIPFEYDSFFSKDFSEVDALPSTNNMDKIFKPGILIQENLFEVITHVAPEKNEKKLAISHASLMLEDFDPPLYELPFLREVPRTRQYLSMEDFGYVADFDPDEDPEEDPEDDHADYPAEGGDGDDEPSDDDDDDTDDEDEELFEDEEDDEEEEEHLALADSSAVPIVDPVLPARDTEALEANEPAPTPISPHTIIPLSQTRLRRARKTNRLEPSMSASMKACITRHAALLLPPLLIPSLPLPLPSPLTTNLTDTGAPLGYRAAGIRIRALLLSTSRITDIPEADEPPQKRACLTTLALESKVEESFAAGAAKKPGPTESDLRRYMVDQTGYEITDTWDEIVDTLMKIAPTTLEEVD
nr:reverse transcriptase domain-containing protein [Tanacetum cinerariifolium]